MISKEHPPELPRAKVDKKQWHQFSKIKRKPTVLLSASILEYKRGR